MDHSEFRDLVTLYLTGELNEEKSDQFEMHFFSCNNCRDYLLQNRSTLLLAEKFFAIANIDEVTEAFNTDSLFSDNKPVSEDKRHKIVSDLIKKTSKHIAAQLKELVSATSFPVLTYSYHTERGEVSTENHYTVGEKIVISIKTPSDKGGYLTIIHYDDDNGIKIIFPNDTSMENKRFNPQEEVKINIEALPPFGTHFLKAFLTERKIFHHDFDSPDGKIGFLLSLNKFFINLSSIEKEEWMESVCTFEVFEN